MNKREAKKEAYFRAANILDNALGGGWPFGETSLGGEDEQRLADAMMELSWSLRKRGEA